MTNILLEDHLKTYAIVGPTKVCDLMLFGFTSIGKHEAQQYFREFIEEYYIAQREETFLYDYQPSDTSKVFMVEIDFDVFGSKQWADKISQYPVIERGSDYLKELIEDGGVRRSS